jgi:hypothetical protein
MYEYKLCTNWVLLAAHQNVNKIRYARIRYVTREYEEYVRARKDSMRTLTCFLPRAWHVGMESDMTESDVQISGCMMSPVHLNVHGLSSGQKCE